MAERTAGPVKPPTIDLVARPASEPVSAGAAEPLAETIADTTPPAEPAAPDGNAPRRPRARKPRIAGDDAPLLPPDPPPAAPPMREPPRPEPAPPAPEPVQVRSGLDWGQIGAAAVIGALFGTALTYAVASIVPMPSRGPVYADPGPALADAAATSAAQAATIADLEQRLGALQKSTTNTQVSLDATITQLDGGFAGVRDEIEAARAAAIAPVDLSAVNDRLRALSARLDAIAAGASSADAGALAQRLSDLEAELQTLREELQGVSETATAASRDAATLKTTVTSLQQQATAATIPTPGPTIGDVALNGLEAALAAGRPFASELDALSRAVPEASVPAAIERAAEAGLPAPEVIADRFTAVVPDMLAARKSDGEAAWQDTAVDWLKGLLAWRPAGEIEGDGPEAVLARLEAAMARRDYVAADALFDMLPPEMRAAAGDLPADIALHAEAAAWIATLRGAPAEVAQ